MRTGRREKMTGGNKFRVKAKFIFGSTLTDRQRDLIYGEIFKSQHDFNNNPLQNKLHFHLLLAVSFVSKCNFLGDDMGREMR